jgi:cardiolipin synthase (CMP-forming)
MADNHELAQTPACAPSAPRTCRAAVAMLNVPNAITLLRLALVPLIGLQLLRGHDLVAWWLFALSALSDWLDGQIARRWNLRTRLGAIADPLADKLTMLTVALVLALQHSLPWWLALAIVSRDMVILAGALAYRWLAGSLEMAPTRLSKLNTALQFLLLLSLLGVRAGLVDAGRWLDALTLLTFASIVASGLQYIVLWGRKAMTLRGDGAP